MTVSELVDERIKRKKEWLLIAIFSVVLLFLTWVQLQLSDMSESLPLVHSIFLFGLVNFNIILFLLLSYFLFRNIAKAFSRKHTGLSGRSLQGKLVAAFMGFSFVPTAIMFFASFVYINSFLEKLSNEKISAELRSAQKIINNDYRSKKTQSYHYADRIIESLQKSEGFEEAQAILKAELRRYKVDGIDLYSSVEGSKDLFVKNNQKLKDKLPSIPDNFKIKALEKKLNSSLSQKVENGNLLRVIVPFEFLENPAALVVSRFTTVVYSAKRASIAEAYEEFRNIDEISRPLKSIFITALALITLTLLVFSTWFGRHLAKQLSIPLRRISKAATRIAKGDYRTVNAVSGSPEVTQLVTDFNKMTEDLESSQTESREANENLKQTLSRLDEHTKYLKVVLANVSTGVISLNKANRITMVNHYAANLLGISAQKCIGEEAETALTEEYYQVFAQLMSSMDKYKLKNIQRETQVDIQGHRIPLQVTITILTDDQKKDLGTIIVFNDLSVVMKAQRAAAWREVARRIAHEIKNPLTPIRLSAQRLQKKFGTEIEDKAFSDCTSMIIDQVDGIKGLVNEFSLYARLPKAELEMSSLNQVLEEALVLFKQAHRNIDFKLIPDEDLPLFMFDTAQIKRVVTNLVDNAVSAKEPDNDDFFVEVGVKYDRSNNRVLITFEDNGPGIPQKVMEHIFEPYVTTKSYGTGLGLAIVHRTIEEHRGSIKVLPRRPKGARFLIELPLKLELDRKEIVT